MKKLCILATAENVETVREKAYECLPEVIGHRLLNYGCSATGEAPVTHWFCPMNGSHELMKRMIAIQNLSIMEVANPLEFLKSQNLKLVKNV